MPLQREGLKFHPGILLPGPHVLQVDLSAWVHPGEASKFAKSWRKIGELATGLIKSDPLEIPVPSHPRRWRPNVNSQKPSPEKRCQLNRSMQHHITN